MDQECYFVDKAGIQERGDDLCSSDLRDVLALLADHLLRKTRGVCDKFGIAVFFSWTTCEHEYLLAFERALLKPPGLLASLSSHQDRVYGIVKLRIAIIRIIN